MSTETRTADPIERPRLLVHICCGPCSLMPLKALLDDRMEVWGFFHNTNIHPFSEFKKRLEAVKALAGHLGLKVVYDEKYSPTSFVRGMRALTGVPRGMPPAKARCVYCYTERLEATAKAASEGGFDMFTTSLLYSHSQDHESIRRSGIEYAERYGVTFLYEDFRRLWDAGINESKRLGLYRQRYCGCAYSKIERYANKNTGNTRP